ncbi:hypothetical protein B0H11DRAFT_1293543 [Mycena galericulata]|nr:hypothetical protein B0H11DRAFT_1293543 [Mycena galericulata]
MIHLDRNHHPAPLSTTTQNKDLILPTNPIDWSALDNDFPPDDYPQVQQKQPSATKGPTTPTDTADPRPASTASSPASPADGNSASPTRERSSSLSPAPSPRVAPDAPPAAVSRLSTPLSELSPPPDDDDEEAPKQEDTSDKPQDTLLSKLDDHDVKPSQQSSNLMPASSPSARPSPPIDSIATPSAAGTEPTSPAPGDPKVVVMLELNEELLKVCIEFQKRKMALAEPQFQAYSARLQSNLAWSARVVDHSGQQVNQSTALPMMDAPPPLDFLSTERIQELYQELPKVFAKDLARRASASSSPVNLKRDRSEDIPTDVMNKRRDTGETKMSASMMPPPPIPSPVTNAATPLTNGMATPPVPADALQNPGMVVDPQQRTRQAQAQLRAAQQQQVNRQMSPPSSANGNPGMSSGPPAGNAIAGPSSGGEGGGMPPHVQQLYNILRTPGHSFVQYMIRHLPGFQQMPVPMQLQKMAAAQNALRERQGMQNPGGAGAFGQTSPVSPNAQMGAGGGQSPQGPMFPMNAGMDLRAMSSTPIPGGGGGGGGGMGMPINGITPQQRQLMLMQQQQRGGGGGGGGGMGPGGGMGMGMSPQQQQQMAFQQQQERMRMEQQQRMERMAAQGGSPPHPGSPMMGSDFPALRSNAASIPGIARIARSPSDGSPGGMTPRMAPARGASLGAEDYQRAMMQQQQQQQQRGAGGMPGQNSAGGFGALGFPPQPAQGWQQNQLQQQQSMQMHGGGGGGQYGMGGGRPGSGYGGVPSPPGSGGGGGMGGQNWGQASGYPFAASPGGGMGADLGMQRHMSGTPAPQMPQNGPPGDADFDPFSWA